MRLRTSSLVIFGLVALPVFAAAPAPKEPPAAREWSKHSVWNEDPIMAPFRDVILTSRAPGWPGPSSRKAAEAVSKYIITDMYAKAVQGMSAEEAVKWAAGEVQKVYSGA